ncbi:GDP-mannose 4,6-dehydratase [Nocardia amamiensis]|uniref:GDP-mannose 4,6-dehydratase n=1 Tax=Nocardia amamiensis TaxID=404578 RepID=A0ABS0CZT7_9NOCA|nr:NAD-dependent epimerase/dehydratase family protein [Nocardia amamiensis]MBF6302101.1 GDP-mannose 4,6-dehydratase [Nocardia amamiensis]
MHSSQQTSTGATSSHIRSTHCANSFGPYQLREKLISLAVTNVLRGRKIPVYGDGLQSRDWLHVLDHCDAVHGVVHAELGPIPKAAATDPGLLSIFDISARHEVTNLDIARMVVTELGLDPAEWIQHIEDRPNHDRRYVINPEKLATGGNGSSPTRANSGSTGVESVRIRREAEAVP